jgi:hypothetical protein
MHGLDDIGWKYGFAVTSYGTRIGARTSDPELLEHLQARIPFGSEPSDTEIVDRLFSVLTIRKKKPKPNRYNLYWDHMLFGKELKLAEMLERFDAITSLSIAELSDEQLFIHAGVVEWQGKAILIPGRSHSGKTTLVAELVKLGATYYSDEFAIIDEEGYVSSYPKPLAIRLPGQQKQSDISVEELGGKSGNLKLPVGLIIASQYKKGASWKPEAMTPGNSLLYLLDNTHSAQRAPERAIRVLKELSLNATTISSSRGEANKVAQLILDNTEKRRW